METGLDCPVDARSFVDRVGDTAKTGVRTLRSPVVRDTIEPIRATGVLALSGTDGRMASVGESSRRGTGRRMLAMPICGGIGVSG